MRRLILALAVTIVGAGCIDTTTSGGPGGVVLYWDFARHAPAQTNGVLIYDDLNGPAPSAGDHACGQSAVDTVQIIAPDGSAIPVPCVYQGVQGVTIDGLYPGNQTFRVTGYRQGVAVYDSSFTLNVVAGQLTPYPLDVDGVQAQLDLFAYLAFGTPPNETEYPSCAAASYPDLGFEIRDVFGNLIDADRVGCSDPLPAIVSSAPLDLDDYDVRLRGYDASNAVVFDSCAAQLQHFAAQTGSSGFAPTLLTLPVPACQ